MKYYINFYRKHGQLMKDKYISFSVELLSTDNIDRYMGWYKYIYRWWEVIPQRNITDIRGSWWINFISSSSELIN